MRPCDAVAPWPRFTSVPFTQTVTVSPRASTTIVFHSPSGFSEPSVRFRMRRASPSAPPHFSAGVRGRRASMSGTAMSSWMHQKSPAFPLCICTSIDFGNIL